MERRGCYCLSRARAPAEGSAAGGGGAEHEQRRRELRAMRLKALKLRAAEEGVGEEELANADDADDVKEEVIRLILERGAGEADSRGGTTPPADEEALPALQKELRALRLRALEKRALAEGVGAEAVEEALDSDAPKPELVALIVRAAARLWVLFRRLFVLRTSTAVAQSSRKKPAAKRGSRCSRRSLFSSHRAITVWQLLLQQLYS